MISVILSSALRENHEEVLQRWEQNVHGCIADDMEAILRTPMGKNEADKLITCAVDLLSAEEYEVSDELHRARQTARETAFRRASVGFSLPDIITMTMALRAALQQTLLNHLDQSADMQTVVDALMALNSLGDAMLGGEIAGYFAHREFGIRPAAPDAGAL